LLSRTQCLKNYAVSFQFLDNAAADILTSGLKIPGRSLVNHIRQYLRSAKLHDLGFLIPADIRLRFPGRHTRKLILSAQYGHANSADVVKTADIVDFALAAAPVGPKATVIGQQA
jgi:hypothetical protein